MMPSVIKNLCCIAALFATICVSGAGEYRDAKTSEAVFNHDALGLMGIERENLATELAAYVSNEFAADPEKGKEAKEESARLEFASRMLGVALRLHASNRAVIVANYKLAHGMKTTPVKADYEPSVLAEYLYTRSKLLIEQGGEQNGLLAGYLLAFSVEIDPTNDDAIYDLEVREVEGRPIDWARLYPVDENAVAGEEEAGEEPVAQSQERSRGGN